MLRAMDDSRIVLINQKILDLEDLATRSDLQILVKRSQSDPSSVQPNCSALTQTASWSTSTEVVCIEQNGDSLEDRKERNLKEIAQDQWAKLSSVAKKSHQNTMLNLNKIGIFGS